MGNLSWDELSSSQISQLGFGGLHSKLNLGKSSHVFFSTWRGLYSKLNLGKSSHVFSQLGGVCIVS